MGGVSVLTERAGEEKEQEESKAPAFALRIVDQERGLALVKPVSFLFSKMEKKDTEEIEETKEVPEPAPKAEEKEEETEEEPEETPEKKEEREKEPLKTDPKEAFVREEEPDPVPPPPPTMTEGGVNGIDRGHHSLRWAMPWRSQVS